MHLPLKLLWHLFGSMKRGQLYIHSYMIVLASSHGKIPFGLGAALCIFDTQFLFSLSVIVLDFVFKYLGSIVHYSLSSEADVDKRIKSATAAFGALKNVFTNRHLDLKLKGRIYVVYIGC